MATAYAERIAGKDVSGPARRYAQHSLSEMAYEVLTAHGLHHGLRDKRSSPRRKRARRLSAGAPTPRSS